MNINKEKSESPQEAYDIIIVGATPGGVAAAVTAARLGHRVALVESHRHIGGMTTSGLGKSDVEQKEFIGGLFKEFTTRVRRHYASKYGVISRNVQLSRAGYYYEPSVAEAVFYEMLNESSQVTLRLGMQLTGVEKTGNRMTGIAVKGPKGRVVRMKGGVFVDATYEGDLYAMAGADYRLGREGRKEYQEPHAGHIFYDYENGNILPGSTGEADDGIQAYTYRYCLTRDRDNSFVMSTPPAEYDPRNYTPYFEDLKQGRLSAPATYHEGWGYYPEHFDTMVRALSVTDLPNDKVDANINPRPLAFPFPEANKGYVEGTSADRKRICAHHRNLTLGLLWFLQNDPGIPEKHRFMARQYHLPLDEFTDNGHFPFQLYVREGRRLLGEYTLTQHDVAITKESPDFQSHADTIAMGEFPIDSFPVHRIPDKENKVLEGYLGMMAHLTRPYEIPYRTMIPVKIDGLIVPVALSATHVAFCSVRMEPTWMSLGQAAGVAAHVCLTNHELPREVSIGQVRELLEKSGQVLKNDTVLK